MHDTPRLQRRAKGERPWFFDDPNVDKVVAMVMGLAGEVAVMHDRLDTLERLLEDGGLIKRGDIEAYLPPAAVAAERAAWREQFLGEVLRIVACEREGADPPYGEAVTLVEDDDARPARRDRTRDPA